MSNNQQIWYFENIDVSAILCPRKMNQGHLARFPHANYKKGEYIWLPQEHSGKMYFLTKGRVKIGTYNESGKEVTKSILGAGEVFGELAIIGEKNRRDFAYVMEDVEACVLTTEDMKTLMREHSQISLFMMRLLGNRTIEMEERLTSMVFKDSRKRIIDYLVSLVERKGRRAGYEYVVYNFITHQEIANLTATSRQTVTTILNELRNESVIEFNRKRLLVRDFDRLKSY